MIAALRLVDQAIRHGNGDPVLVKKRGMLYVLLDAYEPALLDFQAYLRVAPLDGEVYYYKGRVLLATGLVARAKACLERAKELDEESAGLSSALDEAEREVRKRIGYLGMARAIPIEARDGTYWWRRIVLEVELGRLEDASDSAGMWEHLAEDAVLGNWGQGPVLVARGDFDGARELFAEARARGMEVQADKALAELAAEVGDWSEAARRAASVLKDQKDDNVANRLHRLCLLATGKYEEYCSAINAARSAEEHK
ncbi:MAG: tetratricopeptide repeat protein [Planctomycetes bacterium]|nr:tetratricopeptide repeat protein [Planctomycetota bacterium]